MKVQKKLCNILLPGEKAGYLILFGSQDQFQSAAEGKLTPKDQFQFATKGELTPKDQFQFAAKGELPFRD